MTKTFGKVTAVREVSFSLSGGEILGLIGPNGAGKSTLFDLLVTDNKGAPDVPLDAEFVPLSKLG